MKKLLFAAALASAAFPSYAAAPRPDADPAIWVVKDEDTTIYLFGTVHLLDGKSDWFNDEVKAAFDASQEVVLEAVLPEDPAALQPLIVKYAIDPNGKSLSSKLDAALKAKLDTQLAALGVPAAALEPMEPWFVSSALTTAMAQKLGLSGDHGAETIITKAAKASGKPISEVEGFEFQLALFDRIPEKVQVEMLAETLDEVADMEEFFEGMMKAWAAGDTEAVAKIMNEDADDSREQYELLLTNRNAAWAEWIDQRLDKPGSVFMAVGAGHLAGRDSVQDMLAKRGIKAARLPRN